MTPYEQGYQRMMKLAGLRSALTDAMYTLATGRTRLRHGTTSDVADLIRRKGLIPQGTVGGNTDRAGLGGGREVGMSFLSRSPEEADFFARLSAGARQFEPAREGAQPIQDIMRSSGLPGGHLAADVAERVVPGRALSEANRSAGHVLNAPLVGTIADKYLGHLPAASRRMETVDVNIPFRELQKREVPLADIPSPTRSTVTVQGELPPQWVASSPQYQGVSLDEVLQHWRQTAQDPRPLAGEVARQFTGTSHSPRQWYERAKTFMTEGR